MTTSNRGNLQITDLDFDDLKTSLKAFLADQAAFNDFDFEGSGMGVLLNLLAYNTHYLSYYINMIANESFINSANLRESVVQLAKHLNYTPTSIRSAKLVGTVSILPTSGHTPESIVIPRNTIFQTSISGTIYKFVTLEEITITPDENNNYSLTNVNLYEGTIATYTYEVNTNNSNQKFVIPNTNVDTTTLSVQIQNSREDTTKNTYTLSADLTAATSTSKIYFLQENRDEKYEVFFGDGVIGAKPSDKNLILLEYLYTSGPDANGGGSAGNPVTLSSGAARYTYNNVDYTTQNITFTTTEKPTGGVVRDTLSKIRYRAPRVYESMNRAVTAEDYNTLITAQYPEVAVAAVWGGEDEAPPVYGKVYISLQPKTGLSISSTRRAEIASYLSARKIAGLALEFVDPDTLYIVPSSNVIYDQNLTDKTTATIATLVTSAITSYSTDVLEQFTQDFRVGQLIQNILLVDDSILSATVSLKLQKRITPTILGVPIDYELKFNNACTTLSSTSFTYPIVKDDSESSSSSSSSSSDDDGTIFLKAYLDDDGSGNVRVIHYDSAGNKIVIESAIGTINYTTGLVTLTQFEPTAINNNTLKISVIPDSQEIATTRNILLTISSADVSVSVTPKTT